MTDPPHHSRFRYGAVFLTAVIAVLASFILLAGCSLQATGKDSSAVAAIERALVEEVIDGDTVILEDGRRVRYLGIDTPEIGEYYYEEATERNRELVEGKVAELQPGSRDIDDYGRLLRYVYVDGLFVNAELVAQGYAKAYRKGPEEKHSRELFRLEEEARASGKGLWAGP